MKPNSDSKNKLIRECLRIIRNENTIPSYILPNGEEAGYFSHKYVINKNRRRNNRKRERKSNKKIPKLIKA